MGSNKIDSQAIGLDTSLAFSRWLTGREHLHYGLWTGLDVTAANAGAAQDAYSQRLFALLPQRPGLRILDIGGGAGETAKKLIALGHSVEIVIPSAYLAAACRRNAPQARVHECRFQEFQSPGGFDLCLFSESFQYVPLQASLAKARGLLAPGGAIVIGDCFRREGFVPDPRHRTVGGGHRIEEFRAALPGLGLTIAAEDEVTEAVAPSIDLEQALFNVVGTGLSGIDRELRLKRPWTHRALMLVLRLFLSARKRDRLALRLFGQARTSGAFIAANRYLLLRLEPVADTAPPA